MSSQEHRADFGGHHDGSRGFQSSPSHDQSRDSWDKNKRTPNGGGSRNSKNGNFSRGKNDGKSSNRQSNSERSGNAVEDAKVIEQWHERQVAWALETLERSSSGKYPNRSEIDLPFQNIVNYNPDIEY